MINNANVIEEEWGLKLEHEFGIWVVVSDRGDRTIYSEVAVLDTWFSFRRLRREQDAGGAGNRDGRDSSSRSLIAGRDRSSVLSWFPILYSFTFFLEIAKGHTE